MKCRVMMVDDNDNDLLFTRLMLERSGVGFEVLGFERAAEALDHLRQTPDHGVAIILLDINMPVMNGFDFLEAFEALEPSARGGAVVMMLSSSSDPADRDRAARHASVKGYLTKPLDRQVAAALPKLAGLAEPGTEV
ncbi:response regulator [uncultured Hydrogenophaga sp.]|uniref:response regulator n=1 Tax=uncultured Hydrogenophaga sp. TaxID=199683 RepID=UPI00265EF9CF|nr:response regulator [uncultured Hydrogenophaga sp.]